MKKIVVFLLSLCLLCVVLTACVGDGTQGDSEPVFDESESFTESECTTETEGKTNTAEETGAEGNTETAEGTGAEGNTETGANTGTEGDSDPTPSSPENTVPSLSFQLINGGTAYAVTGIGTITDTSIVIPASHEGKPVISIVECAFADCKNLTDIFIPQSVTRIGAWAFNNCSKIAIYMEASSRQQGFDSYWNCDQKYDYEAAHYSYPTVWNVKEILGIQNGVTYALKNDNTVCVANYNGSVADVVIAETMEGYPVTSISASAFDMSPELASVIIPESIKNIGAYAFDSCTGLSKVIIPSTVETINAYIFSRCVNLKIYAQSASIPTGWNQYWSFTQNGYYAGDEYPVTWNVKEILSVEEGVTYTLKNDDTVCVTDFDDSVTHVELAKSIEGYPVTAIGSRAFSHCSNMTAITIPLEITSIAGKAFYESSDLTICAEAASQPTGWNVGWNYLNSYNDYHSYYYPVVWNAKQFLGVKQGAAYVLRNDDTVCVGKIGYAQSNVVLLNEIDGYRVEAITGYAVDGLNQTLTDITISGNITWIYDNAFRWCYNLKHVIFSEGSQLKRIGELAFNGCYGLDVITIPDSVERIGYGAFSYHADQIICVEAESKPSGWDAEWVGSTEYEGELPVVIWNANGRIIQENGLSYAIKNDGTACIAGFEGNQTELVIPSLIQEYPVTAIVRGPFVRSGLKKLVLSDSIVFIEAYAFKYSSGLTDVVIPNSVEKIGEYAFYECNRLMLYVEAESKPDGWSYYWNATYEYSSSYCSTIWNFKSVLGTELGVTYVLRNDNTLCITDYDGLRAAVVIPSSVDGYAVTEILSSAFADCQGLTKITVPNSVTVIQANAFDGCEYLTIYVEAAEQPAGWASNWNPDNLPVEWDHTIQSS